MAALGLVLAWKVMAIARTPLTTGFRRGATPAIRKALLKREAKHWLAKKIIFGSINLVIDPYNNLLVPISGGQLISSEEAALMALRGSFTGPTALSGKDWRQLYLAYTLDPFSYFYELGTHGPSEIRKRLEGTVTQSDPELIEIPVKRNGMLTTDMIRVIHE